MEEKDDIFTKGGKVEGQIDLQNTRKNRREEEKIIQLIVFLLGDEEFGTDISQVREIIRVGSITPLPDSPDFIIGIANVRGEIAVVIDFKKRFSLQVKKEIEEKHIIMTELDNNLFGLAVDEVVEVLRVPETNIKMTPEIVTRIDRAYISGVLTTKNRLIVLLDLKKVLSKEELAKLSEIRIRQREDIEERKERVEEKEAEAVEMKAKKEKVETPA